MRYIELLEAATPHSFWINANTGEIIPTPDEHIKYVYKNPEQFGLDRETVQQVKNNVGGGWTMAIMEMVTEQGWVRGGKHFEPEFDNGYFLQGYSDEHLWKAANILADKTYFDILALDVFFETHSSNMFTRLYGDELEHWLKTGKYFSKMRESEEVLASTSACVPIALQRVTGASNEEIQRVCKKHHWSKRSGMNIGQTIGALKSLGFDYKGRNDLAMYRKTLKDGRSAISSRTLNQLLKIIPNGKFLVNVRGHTIAVIDGKIFDDAAFGLKHKVHQVVEVLGS